MNTLKRFLLIGLLCSTIGLGLYALLSNRHGFADGKTFAWQQTNSYIAPNFRSYFPNDPEGAKKLEKIWSGPHQNLPAEQLMAAIRAGLRRYSGNRKIIISEVASQYVERGHNAAAIELLYHAADFSDPKNDPYGVRHAAVYGLSHMRVTTPAIRRALVDLCMAQDDTEDLRWVAVLANGEGAALIEYLKPYLQNRNAAVREKAEGLAKIFSGDLDYYEWAKSYSAKYAPIRYTKELPALRKTLAEGTSTQRLKLLTRMTQQEREILLALDDSFLDPLAACAQDRDPMVRIKVATVVGIHWFEYGNEPSPSPKAVELMLSLARDKSRDVAQLARWFLLELPEKDRRIVRCLFESPMRLTDEQDKKKFTKALCDEQETLAELVTEVLEQANPALAQFAKSNYLFITGREYPGPSPIGAARTITVELSKPADFSSIQKAIDAASAGSVIRIGPGIYEGALTITRPITLEGAGPDKTTIFRKNTRPSEAVLKEMEKKLEAARSKEEQQALMPQFMELMRAFKANHTTVTISGAQGVVLRNLKFTDPAPPPPSGTLPDDVMVACSKSKVRFENCQLVGTPSDALRSRTTDLQMDKCLVAASWGTGVVLTPDGQGGTATIRDCDIRNCYYVGISIGYNTPVTIEGCRISGAAWHGITCGGSPRIVNNLIFDNYRSGIYDGGKSTGTIKGNVFYHNEGTAIGLFDGSRGQFEGNSFIDNQIAIGMRDFAKPILLRNLFAGNAKAVICYAKADCSEKFSGMKDNLFWNNKQELVASIRNTATNAPDEVTIAMKPETDSVYQDPLFTHPEIKDFALKDSSPARAKNIGVAKPLSFESPWPLQAEEQAIIPDGDSRQEKLWKRTTPNSL